MTAEMNGCFLPDSQSSLTIMEIRCELEKVLPESRFRQEVLRRAELTLAEARALAEVLDHLEAGIHSRSVWLLVDRAAFGVQPLNLREAS